MEAGAEVIETNTFGAHRFKLGPHGLEAQVRKINAEGARIAREAAQGRALVAGSIGPVGKPLEPYGNITFDEAVAAYREQVEGLRRGRGGPVLHRDHAVAGPGAGRGHRGAGGLRAARSPSR